MKNAYLMLFALLSSSAVHALECPFIPSAPYCPKSGTTLLDETYPTQAFVISNSPFFPTKEAKSVTQNFVNKIIANYDFNNVPQIMISVQDPVEFRSIVLQTKAALIQKKIPSEKIEKIISQLSHVPAPNYTWQQDWFESMVNLDTGSPEIRPIASYERVQPNNGALLSDAGEKCKIVKGATIKSGYGDPLDDPRLTGSSYGSGEMGGNIEGAPGGFCMAGDNQAKTFTTQFCGNPDNIIQLQTSWLQVGHVDELFKIIPTQFNDGRPKECEFTLMSASPKKALELMKNPELGKMSFSTFNNPDADPEEIRDTRTIAILGGNRTICSYVSKILKDRPATQDLSPAVKAVLLKLLFGPEAFAAVNVKSLIPPLIMDDKDFNQFNDICAKNLDKVSNFEIQKMMSEDPAFMALNTAVDQSMDKDRALIKSKILSRLPQCAKYYSDLEVPNLFYGDYPLKDSEGNYVLPKPGSSNSFLPNPTNSVIMNKTVTFPDSGNALFNRYLTEELTKKKMKSDFISTWDYAHLGKGNIHCASHSIPYCRPNPKGSK